MKDVERAGGKVLERGEHGPGVPWRASRTQTATSSDLVARRSMATEGTFVLADIGGYTSFLTDVGIEHGKEITTTFSTRSSSATTAAGRSRTSRATACSSTGRVAKNPESWPATLESCTRTFCAGRSRSRSAPLVHARLYTHNDLRLKFIVHAGEFDTQKIGGARS